MVTSSALIFRIPIKGIVCHQAPAQQVERRGIIRISAILLLAVVVNAIAIGVRGRICKTRRLAAQTEQNEEEDFWNFHREFQRGKCRSGVTAQMRVCVRKGFHD